MSCPADLEPYKEAHNLEVREADNLAYAFCGNYVLSAVAVAVERNLAGKKSKAEYIKDPILKEYGISDEEKKQKQIDLFVAKMEIMKANFERNKR
ncbi:MAG: hypothetical protein IKH28_02875 [Lachnospiraceae bacterium]|nr:hypothetical protein [Lachnospiraceae bacterium]